MKREDRLQKKLLPDCSKKLKNSLIDRIVLSYLLTGIIKGSNKEDNYSIFLKKDDTFVYSLILLTDYVKFYKVIQTNIVDLKQSENIHSGFVYLEVLTKLIADYVNLIFFWYDNLSEGNKIKDEIQDIFLKGLKEKLDVIYTFIESFGVSTNSQECKYFIKTVISVYKKYNIEWKKDEEKYENKDLFITIFDVYRDLSESLLRNLDKLQQLVKSDFYNNLCNGLHAPHISLLLVFFKLLEDVDKSIYDIRFKHLYYYYCDLLKFYRLDAVKDKTIIFLKTENDQIKLLPSNSHIIGIKDDKGNDIVFKTDKNIEISGIWIKKIRTVIRGELKINKFDKIPESTMEVAEYDMDEVYDSNQNLYLFSKQHSNVKNLNKVKNTNPLSYIIANNILCLKDGERAITIEFYLNDASSEYLISNFRFLNLYIKDKEKTLKLFCSLLEKTVKVKYTSDEWLTIIEEECVKFRYNVEKNSIVLEVKIKQDKPGFIKNIYEIYCIKSNSLPFLQIELKNSELLWVWILFYTIYFLKINIKVNVNKSKNYTLQNDYYKIDNVSIFEPFSNVPKLESNFYIGSKELFSKDLTDLGIHIEWNNIPEDFGDYYNAYKTNTKNEDFKIRMLYLENSIWNPNIKENAQIFNLFETEEINNKKVLKKTREINNIDLNLLGLNNKHELKNEEDYLNKNTLNGFLRFELCSPYEVFGHQIYPQILNKELKKENSFFKRYFKVEVNPPYTPTIKDLYINYSAEEEFNNSNTTNNNNFIFLKTAPFEYDKVAFLEKEHLTRGLENADFLTQYAYAVVEFEIKNSVADIFSLYFHIDEASIMEGYIYDKPIWQYFSNNIWEKFPDKYILYDETENLTKSGIIKFKKPKITNLNDIIFKGASDNSFFVHLIFMRPQKYFPTIINIYPNAIQVTRFSVNITNKIQPNTLKTIENPDFKDVKVYQPNNSYGGKEEETTEQMYTRISERLKHKNRCITNEDYEKIVLEKFPEISYVQCLKCNIPGTIVLSVIADKRYTIENNRFFPQASSDLLNRIREEVQKYSSPFIKISVVNVDFEKIKFVFKVKMKDPQQNDIYIKKLNTELKNLISPWLFNNTNDITILNELKVYDVIHFIKTRSYVKSVSNFFVMHKSAKGISISKDYNEKITVDYPYSIFYSVAEHTIIIDDNLQCKNNNIGIGNMNIEQDFIVGPFSSKKNDNEVLILKGIQENIDNFYMYFKN